MDIYIVLFIAVVLLSAFFWWTKDVGQAYWNAIRHEALTLTAFSAGISVIVMFSQWACTLTETNGSLQGISLGLGLFSFAFVWLVSSLFLLPTTAAPKNSEEAKTLHRQLGSKNNLLCNTKKALDVHVIVVDELRGN